MAVKARETLKSGQLSLPVMGVLLVAIISYTFLYNRVIDQFDDYQLKTIIGVISLTIMIGFFIISLRYISISFEMLLTHDRLIIERKFFFVKKQVAELMLAQVLEILPEAKAKKHKGNRRNFTLLNIEGKKKYVLRYQEQEKIYSIKLQYSGEFYESLKRQVKIVGS